jgi:hypothetical protein
LSASPLIRRVVPPVGVLALLLALAPAASAAQVDLAGGDTNVRVDRGTLSAVTGAGIAIAPTGAAKATGRQVRFPIRGGRLDPAAGAGTVNHRGGLRFSRGGRSLELTRFRIQGRFLSALAGGHRVRILRLRAGTAVVRRTATTTTVSGVRLELTRAAARALNATLGTNLFARGIVLGTARVHARLAELFVQDGSTSLAVDAGAAAALASQGIVPGLIAPASANSDGSLAFPITRGRVDARTFAGLVRHSGGLSLTKGTTRVELTRFDIEIDGTPQLTALVGGSRVPILDLDLSGLTQSIDGLDVTLGNVRATLTAQAAAALNQAFGTTAFSEGLLLGVATVRAEL